MNSNEWDLPEGGQRPPDSQEEVVDRIEDFLEIWTLTVQKVEDGYPLDLDDYKHDLWRRQLLEEWLPSAPEEMAQRVHAALVAIDLRFDTATVATDRPLLPFDGWWWKRVPAKRNARMNEGLLHSGSTVTDEVS